MSELTLEKIRELRAQVKLGDGWPDGTEDGDDIFTTAPAIIDFLLTALDAARERFDSHTKAVGIFLSEMSEIYSLDALDPSPEGVKETVEALLRVSREIREKMDSDNECLMADCTDAQAHFCGKHYLEVHAPAAEEKFALSGQCDNAAHSACPYPEKCCCACHVPSKPFIKWGGSPYRHND